MNRKAIEAVFAAHERVGKAVAPAPRVRSLSVLPTCAVCNKPVDRMTEEEDPTMGRLILTAWCHGSSQRVVLDEGETVATLGAAFIPEGAPRLGPG